MNQHDIIRAFFADMPTFEPVDPPCPGVMVWAGPERRVYLLADGTVKTGQSLDTAKPLDERQLACMLEVGAVKLSRAGCEVTA